MTKVINEKFSKILMLITFLGIAIFSYLSSDKKPYEATCSKEFEGKIIEFEGNGGIIWVKLKNKEELIFSLGNSKEHGTFPNYVKSGFLLRKKADSDTITTINPQTKEEKIWITNCKYFQ